ncbi:MAG: ABC transporter substrate-binding protein, partial [Microbacteriaceae bacterium]
MKSSRRRTHLAKWGAVVSIAALALSGCASTPDDGGEPTPSEKGTLNIGVSRSPNSFDPLLSFLGGQYMQHLDPVYDTLIKMNADGSFSPSLATEWKYIDGTSFELKLRDDVVFSDGTTKFNAEVVKTNLDRLKTVNGPQTSDLSNQYESTEIVDDHTVIVHLSGPNPDLERIFSQLIGMMVNPTALAANEEGIATNPAGSGPYVLDEANTV